MKKISWGMGIVITLAIFFLINVAIVIFAFSQKVDLVTDNYYEKDLKYEQEIIKQRNTKSLSSQIQIEKLDGMIKLIFPEEISPVNTGGEVHFYRPSDSIYDKKFSLKLNEQREQYFDLKNFPSGYWIIKIDFESDGTNYLDKKTLIL